MDLPLAQAVVGVVALTLVRAVLGVVARPVARVIVFGGVLVLVGMLSPTTATAMLATGVRWLVRLCTLVAGVALASG